MKPKSRKKMDRKVTEASELAERDIHFYFPFFLFLSILFFLLFLKIDLEIHVLLT